MVQNNKGMGRKYQVIYADPPWTYTLTGSVTNARGLAKQHYETMPLDDICDLAVSDIATDNALLFMWATFPMMAEALKTIESWGFIYKTAAFVWVKQNSKSKTPFWGMGAYTRANAEVCLLAIRPKTKAKQQVLSNSVHQLLFAPKTSHSTKPPETRQLIEKLLGDVPRIELFARSKTEGWDVWGNEVENDIILASTKQNNKEGED